MRITGGRFSGRKLFAPATREIRPMRDAVRMALFNILADAIDGARFLDLFAGTGSVGIEALSRGASQATFVDKLPAALSVLQKNLDALDLIPPQTRFIRADVFEWLKRPFDAPFDVIFIGPPYGKGLAHRALQAFGDNELLQAHGVVTVEVFRKDVLAEDYQDLVRVDERLYGDNLLAFYRWQKNAC